MDKLYTCAKQGRTLLFTIVLLLIAPLSILTFGQSPCSSPVTRQATNGKATNTNIYDDIAIAMTNLLGDGTEAAWVMEGTGTFIENPDGTARFQCVVKQFGDYSTPRRLAVDITLTGKSYSPDASGPYNQTGVSTDSWYYYYGLSGSLKGLDALAGGELSLKIHMHPFQVGIGANQLFNTEDQTSNGAGGWFEWTVVAQPDNSALQFTNYIPGFTVSDIAILLSGTPAEPCPTLGSIGDQVYCDANNNGIFDTGDSTITGLTITLCDANFQTITTQAVDADGKYLFTGLTPGIYNVKFPEATLDGKPQVNLGPINVVLGVGQNYLDADKGYYKPIVCSVNSNFIVKACNDNLPVLNGSNLAGHEYMWLMSTSSCPTDLNQAIVGATGTNFNFTSRPSVTTYLVRIARPVGCTVWSVQNASNCVAVLPTDCDPCVNDTIPPTITCPLSINKDVTNMAGTCWTINYNMPTATDNCGSATVTIESGMPSGSCFAVGVHKVIFKAVDAKGNVSRCTLIINITTNISCNVSGNTITKVCVNNIPVLNGSMLANHEYMWLKSTTGCPTQSSQAIAGATGQNYTLPSRVTTTTYFIRCARPKGCTTWGITNESNCVTVYATDCAPINCTVSGNTISKACVNNVPVINGTALANHEYMWLKSTTGCPTQSSQAIAGATGQNYTLPSRVTTTTYFIRCARPVGCTSWSNTGSESNCVTVYATDCAPINCTVSGNTISKTCVNNIPVINGTALANHEYMWLKSTTGCPTQSSQAIAGATGQNYTLPSRVTTTTYFIRCARPVGCTSWSNTGSESNCVTVYATDCAPINCTVSGNTISKTCVNNIPVINGTALANHEYMWLKSTTGCPTQSSQAIAGATGQNYTLPSRVTTTTYFIRCARPVGCTSWSNTGSESNCVTVYATDCAPAACDINFSSTKTYRIINKKSGKAVDVSGAGTNNDCPVIQWTYNAQANQQWRFFSLGSGYFKVMARHSSKYLACHYTSDASKVYQYDYYSGGYKDWKVECVGTTGFYRLVHRASGKVLDVTGGATTDGTKLQIYTWNGSDAQLFKIEEVTTATYSIASNSVLAVNATAESDRVRLGFMSNTGYDNDYYTVEKMNDATGSFEKMSTVNNTQFDDQVQTHVAYDVNPTEGDNFYRVKVTLNDGTEKLTDVKKVTFKRMIGFGAYPNPASDELNVNLSEYTGKAVDIVIYNTFGKVVSREHIDNVANSVYKIDVNEFATGQYLIRVSAEGKRDAAQQVMIQK